MEKGDEDLVSMPVIFYVLYLIAGTFAAVNFCCDKVFNPIPFYKKIIIGYCLILYPIKRFRYWALKGSISRYNLQRIFGNFVNLFYVSCVYINVDAKLAIQGHAVVYW